VDEVAALTGFRPDLSWLSEVRLELDATLQAPLAPLIDPKRRPKKPGKNGLVLSTKPA